MLDRAAGGQPGNATSRIFPSPTMTDEVVLAFDFGTRRIGVALGNSVTRSARALDVIDSRERVRWPAIAALVAAWQPQRFVVGLPRHPDGTEHEMSRRCERFARQLSGRYGLPASMVDERYSSAVLEDAGGTDAHAAAVILQQWFDAAGSGAAGAIGTDGPRRRAPASEQGRDG